MHASVINPRYIQCYADEGQMGMTSKVWRGSMSGRYEASAQRVVLTKRVVGVMVRLDM